MVIYYINKQNKSVLTDFVPARVPNAGEYVNFSQKMFEFQHSGIPLPLKNHDFLILKVVSVIGVNNIYVTIDLDEEVEPQTPNEQ